MQRYRITVEEIAKNETILVGTFECGEEHMDAIKAIRDAAAGSTTPAASKAVPETSKCAIAVVNRRSAPASVSFGVDPERSRRAPCAKSVPKCDVF